MTDTTAKLVTMANQIARHLTHEKDPTTAVAQHIGAFWTVRMCRQLHAHGATGVDAVAWAALDRLMRLRDAA